MQTSLLRTDYLNNSNKMSNHKFKMRYSHYEIYFELIKQTKWQIYSIFKILKHIKKYFIEMIILKKF